MFFALYLKGYCRNTEIMFFSSWAPPEHTRLKQRGAFPVATVMGILSICIIQSFSLQAVVKQLLLWLSIRPTRYHFPIHKKREHGRLQEAGQKAQVGHGLTWEEGTLKHLKAIC